MSISGILTKITIHGDYISYSDAKMQTRNPFYICKTCISRNYISASYLLKITGDCLKTIGVFVLITIYIVKKWSIHVSNAG